MKNDIQGKKVAILATDGFEQSELLEPRQAIEDAGATAVIISLEEGEIKGWDDDDWGDTVEVDQVVAEANPDDFDALVLPGGVMNPDKLRTVPAAVKFVKAFFAAGKPVAAICHGPQILIEADVVNGRTLTSFPSLQTDLRNAGATWVDEEVMVDNGLVTSRKPADLAAFNAKLIEEIGEGRHEGQAAAIALGGVFQPESCCAAGALMA